VNQIPPLLLERLGAVLPPERLEATLAASRRQEGDSRRLAIRVNTLRATREQVLASLAAAGVQARAVTWMPDALVVTSGSVEQVQSCTAHGAGELHIQSLSSMAVAHALAPRPGARLLDACAAPGSKTSHCAALMGNVGSITAADASRSRIFRLHAVLQHLGAQAATVVERAERWGRRAPGSFDMVLVDVPCSGEGRALAGDASAAADWSIRKCKRLASEQKSILHSAIEACVSGGVIVYSTCTTAPEENEEVLARALRLYAGRLALEPLPVEVPGAMPALTEWAGKSLPTELEHARRIAPLSGSVHPDGEWLEGFFIARLRKL
jgi:16S rRNA (cytosine1407-C5)-methyltransferase